MTPVHAPRNRLLTAAIFASMVLIWGTTWLVIRIGLEYYPPFFSLAVRFLIAGPLFLLIMKLRGDPIPWRLRDQPVFLAVGLFTFVISFGIVYWGEQYLSSGLTAVIFALMPLFTGVQAHYLLANEPLRPQKLIGLLIALVGILVINLADLGQIHPKAPLAAGLMIISPFIVALATVISKRSLDRYPHLAFSALPMTYGGIAHLILWWILERNLALPWSWPGMAAIAYLTFFGSMITFASYYWLLERIEVSKLNLTAYLTPLIALFVGYAFGGEKLTPRMMLGAALVFAGIAVATRVRAARGARAG
jgi:drug/metabolite transporter (DMT)-like permease